MHRQQNGSNRFLALLLGVVVFVLAGFVHADPPGRVARVGYVNGPVSFSPAGEDDWVEVTLNRPLVTGDRLWADAGGRVELQIGTAAIRLGETTSVTLLNLDDRVAQLQLAQGTLNVRVRRLQPDQVVEIDTPNLAYVISRPGQYRVNVDPNGDATQVRTSSGQAEVHGEGASYVVDAGKAYRFVGTGLRDYEDLALPRVDEFDRWAQDRDRGYDNSISARYVSRDVIGSQDLDGYGTWRAVPDYGDVWTPTRVGPGWSPYHDGHWAWVEPWGWTWVDDAPWGFAVSHYGRWANIGGSWGWIPGPVVARAVYAPALVAFVGGTNFQLSISSGNVGAVGWFPLGPRDVYRPAYPVSRTYFTNVNTSNTVINNTNITNVYNNRNVTNVTNVTNVNNVTYVNQQVPGAVVTMPRKAFAQSEPVAQSALRVPHDTVIRAPVTAVAEIAPMPVSVRGAASEGRKPPPQVLERSVVARNAPPSAPVGFAAKERVLAGNPGRPIDPSALAALRPATPVSAPKVVVVAPTRNAHPVAAPPPQAVQANQRGKGEPPVEPSAMVPGAQRQPPPQANQRGRGNGEQPAAPNAVAPGAQQQPPPQTPAPRQPARDPAPQPIDQAVRPPSAQQGPAVRPPPRAAAPPQQGVPHGPPEPGGRLEQRDPPASSSAPTAAPPVRTGPPEQQRGRREPPPTAPIARLPEPDIKAERRNQPVASPAPVAAPPVQRAPPQQQRARPEPPAADGPKQAAPASPASVVRPPESGQAGGPPPGPPPPREQRGNKPRPANDGTKGDEPGKGDEERNRK